VNFFNDDIAHVEAGAGTGMTMSAVMSKRKLKKLLLTNSLTIA